MPLLLNLRFAVFGVPAALAACCGRLYAQRPEEISPKESGLIPLVWVLLTAGLFLGLTIEVCGFFRSQPQADVRLAVFIATTILWSLFALVFFLLGAEMPSRAWRAAGLALLTVVAVKAAVVDPVFLSRYPFGFPLILNLKFLSAGVVLFVLAYAAVAYAEGGFQQQAFEKDAVAYLWSLFLALLFVELNVETVSAFSVTWRVPEQHAAFALSAVWVVYGFGMLLIGILRRILPLRIAALCLFGATLLKIWTVDLRMTELLLKMAILLGSGVIFLLGAYFYRRFGSRLFGRDSDG